MTALPANKKAHLTWEIGEKLEAGIELFGHEVKALKGGQGSLEGAHVGTRGMEAFLMGATIPPYQMGNTPEGYDPTRARRLLLTREEIERLIGLESKKGEQLVPLHFFLKGNLVKLAIGIGRHKKKHDKRASIKKRESARDIEREMKRG